MVFRALIVLFCYGYNIEIYKIILHRNIQNNLGNFSNVAFFYPMQDFFRMSKGGHGPMVKTLV